MTGNNVVIDLQSAGKVGTN